jgi:hypothetical protein
VASYSALPEPMLARSGRLPTGGDFAYEVKCSMPAEPSPATRLPRPARHIRPERRAHLRRRPCLPRREHRPCTVADGNRWPRGSDRDPGRAGMATSSRHCARDCRREPPRCDWVCRSRLRDASRLHKLRVAPRRLDTGGTPARPPLLPLPRCGASPSCCSSTKRSHPGYSLRYHTTPSTA